MLWERPRRRWGKYAGGSETGGILGAEIYKMRRGHAREVPSWEKESQVRIS